MENNEKIKSSLQNLDDTAAESVAGGAHLKMIICCTCGPEINIHGPQMSQYYNNNICPICHGQLKNW